MGRYSVNERKTIRVVALFSAFCFWTFSIIYLAVFQGDLMALRIDSLFSDKLIYNVWGGALVITFVLWLLQRLIRRLGWFGRKGYALSYTPSFLLLGAMTFYADNYEVPLAVCVFGGFMLLSVSCFAGWSRSSTYSTILGLLNLNLQELLILCCLTVAIGNANDSLHHELSMSSAFAKGDYDKVLRIGEKSFSVSEKMADYRIRAMEKEGKLGELLFSYPQYYANLSILTEKNVSAREATDYRMASLLLNKDLKTFCSEIMKDEKNNGMMPRYYVEALVLYNYLHPEHSVALNNKESVKEFENYLNLQSRIRNGQKNIKGKLVEKNTMMREFGTTYWYYYMYN